MLYIGSNGGIVMLVLMTAVKRVAGIYLILCFVVVFVVFVLVLVVLTLVE